MELNSKNDRKDIILSSKTKASSASVSSSTRISETQTQNVRVSTTFSQGFFPVTMNSSNAFAGDIEQQFARDFMRLRLDNMTSPGGGSGIANTNGVVRMNGIGNMFQNSTLAAASVQTVQTQQQQTFTSTSSSNSWSTDMSSFDTENDNKRTEVATRAFGSFASAGGSLSSHSISTNSGFTNFPTSFSNNQVSSLLNRNGPQQGLMMTSRLNNSSTGNNPLVNNLDVPLSPERVSFTFRNFKPPTWAHPGGTAFGKDMKFEGPDGSVTRIQTRGQTQVRISEAFMTSTNGSIESFGGRQMVMRQSYGASESESDDDDEFSEATRSTLLRKKATTPALKHQSKLAIMDKPPAYPYAPSEDDRSTICSEVESEMSEAIETPRASIIEEPTTPEHKKCFRVAQELLTTERTYVRILHLIDQEFHFRVDTENRNKQMFPNEIVTQMFCNIKSLYQLHNEHLLPRLESRLERWEDDPRVGDIMKEFAPFLKMYSEYVQNFDNSINLINYYRDKNKNFANIITEIQKLEACANLPIQHHLIGPIQRIPRYRLLLEAYIKRLPDNSNDRKDSELALSIVSRAAEHANEAMRRNATFKKLLEVQEQIKGAIDLVSPTRTLIKEGKVSKISARNDSHQDRYLFLFSDMVLLCSLRAMARIDLISSAPYQLRAKLDVAELTISEGDDLEIANSFYINDDIKRIELYTSSAEEKRAWMEAMYQARTDLMARKSSLRPGSQRLSVDDIGVVEPAKIKSNSVTKCMECNAEFSFMKKRHHCHACGSVVCDKCSRAKVKMEYGEGKLRVCDSCKIILQGKQVAKRNGHDASTPDELIEKAQGVLDVPGSIPAVLSGYLDLRLREKKEWTCRWFALRTDFVLYCYSKEKDERATTATPIPGMDVAMADELPKNEVSSLPATERDRVFRITHPRGRKHFFFLAPSRETALNWYDKLKQASKADLNCSANAN